MNETTVGTARRGAYERRHRVPAGDGRLVVCVCGTRLRVAGAWTCFVCGTCHRMLERNPDPDETELLGG